MNCLSNVIYVDLFLVNMWITEFISSIRMFYEYSVFCLSCLPLGAFSGICTVFGCCDFLTEGVMAEEILKC